MNIGYKYSRKNVNRSEEILNNFNKTNHTLERIISGNYYPDKINIRLPDPLNYEL